MKGIKDENKTFELAAPLLTPVFDVPTVEYAALGDSFSAGTNTGGYLTSGPYANGNIFCHRSKYAYSMNLDLSELFPDKRVRKWFYACHGAETKNITHTYPNNV